MCLYSGGLIIGRISASEIWGAYFSEGLFIYLFNLYICIYIYIFFSLGGGGGGSIIGILRYLTRATSFYLRKKAGFFSSFTAKNTYSTEKSGNEDAEGHEASTDKEIQELTDAVMKTFSLENPKMFDKYNISANSCARPGYFMRSVLLWNLMYLQ